MSALAKARTKGLSAVLREWAGNYEEGSFDTEAGLMAEAADLIEAQAAELETWAAQAMKEDDCRQMWQARALAAESALSEMKEVHADQTDHDTKLIESLQSALSERTMALTDACETCVKIVEAVGNFGDYQRAELTEDFGQPRYDMMGEIIAAIREAGRRALSAPNQGGQDAPANPQEERR